MHDETFGGLSFAELNEVADIAARIHVSSAMPWGNRAEFALCGVIDAIVAAGGEPLGRRRLVSAGVAGITTEINERARLAGRVHGRDMPRYAMWHHGENRTRSASFEDAVDERMTLRQVWPALTERDQETLTTCMWNESDQAAASELGLSKTTYAARLMNARIRAKTIWFAPELPPAHYGAAGRKGPGWNLAQAIRDRVNGRNSKRRRAAA